LTAIEGSRRVGVPPILFEKLSAEWVETNRTKFAGVKDGRVAPVVAKEPP
jgi:methionyl-tRNA synthetase